MSNALQDIEAELAALADGSLAQERREDVLNRVRQSPELEAALVEQQRAVAMMAGVEVRAPARLHGEVEAMLAPDRSGSGHRRRAFRMPRLGVAAGGLATATVAVAVAVALSGGGSPGLNVQQAAALALSPATTTAPAESNSHRAQLAASVDGVAFPYWKERFGWRGSGAREDTLGGRAVTTVFYTDTQGRRIGYAIVSGRAPTTSGGTTITRWGVSYRVFAHGGATVVTWERSGHLCVMAGRGMSAHTLVSLASWGSKKPQAA
jgi:tellurite resistance protein